MQTIAQQLANAEGRLTQLQQTFVAESHDADQRHLLAEQIRATRDEITRLYELLPA
jgi:hypothetical protein